MNLVSGISIYFVCWWLTWMAVLPLGVHPQGEEGEIVPGTVASAPVKPYMFRKVMLTTVLAFIPLGLAFAVMNYDILSFDDFTFIPVFTND